MWSNLTILGLRKFIDYKKSPIHYGLVNKSVKNFVFGSPVVYQRRIGVTYATSLVSQRKSFSDNKIGSVWPVSQESVVHHDITPVHETMRVIETTDFDMSKVPRLLSCVRDIGAVSFIMNNLYASENLAEIVRGVFTNFEYAQTIFRAPSLLTVDKDKIKYVITFIDIRHCLPVYDSRNPRGIGVVINKMAKEQYKTRQGSRCELIAADSLRNIKGVRNSGRLRKTVPVDDALNMLLPSGVAKLKKSAFFMKK
ncbi:MAG: hypothetical protein PVG39_18415 [Desulfobacteraceae bacterium]|jgi:hypothetical protein